ncbi:MAG: LLM class flavin-dependent oxidoreductase [Candidatus Bathyarchaeota archaeon]|nr:LLM class flavin-dependent oxidoreductase [Candidatus Bathyarchaeota archaeon]
MSRKTKFGIYIANHGITSKPQDYVKLAKSGEECGWEGFFLWDHVFLPWAPDHDVLDPWVMLSAIAAQTNEMIMGTTVTPLARRRPMIIAREAITIDRLSSGRFVLGVGLGGSAELKALGEEEDPKTRGAMLDESLAILKGLWSGTPFTFEGKHFRIAEPVKFKPGGNIKIWVGGNWPNKKPFRRAAKYDGIFPLKAGSDPSIYPQDYREILSYIGKYRESLDSFDLVKSILTVGDKEEDAYIHDFMDMGVNWLLEAFWPARCSLKEIQKRIERGPPE